VSSRTDREYHSAHREMYHARTDKILARILKACDGMSVYELDLRTVQNEEPLLRAISNTMNFPEYFGMNWDATIDCLRELAELDTDGVLLQIRPATEDRLELPVWLRFLGCVQDAAQEFESDFGKKLVVVFYPETSAGSGLAVVLGGTKLVRPPKR